MALLHRKTAAQVADACRNALVGAGVAWSATDLPGRHQEAVYRFARLHAGTSRSLGYVVGRFLALCKQQGLIR